MNRLRPMAIICLLVSAPVAACRGGGDRSPVIATAGGRELSRAGFERFLAMKLGEFTEAEAPDSIRSQMLDEYISRRIILDEASRAGLNVTDAEVEQAVQDNPQIRSTAANSLTREELVNDLLIEKYYRQVLLRDVRVPVEEIQQYVEANETRLTDRPGFYVREIRVQTAGEAERLRREVVDGRKDFARLATMHSEAPNSEQGGLSRYDEGQLPATLQKAIQLLRPGDVSPVIQSSFGFHIFRLERRIQPPAAGERRAQADERRAQLAEELIARRNQQALDEALERLSRSAGVSINDASLGFTYTGRFRHN